MEDLQRLVTIYHSFQTYYTGHNIASFWYTNLSSQILILQLIQLGLCLSTFKELGHNIVIDAFSFIISI